MNKADSQIVVARNVTVAIKGGHLCSPSNTIPSLPYDEVRYVRSTERVISAKRRLPGRDE